MGRTYADQPLDPLPVLCAQQHRRLQSYQTVPPALALRQRGYTTLTVQLLYDNYTRAQVIALHLAAP